MAERIELHDIVPHIEMTQQGGAHVNLADFRGRRNLVLAVVEGPGCEPCMALLHNLSESYSRFVDDETEVLAVVRGPVDEVESMQADALLPFPVFADEDGHIHRAILGREDGAIGLFVTDRYGEVYWSFEAAGEHEMPPVEEALEWTRLIECECPECGVPEWPAA